MLSKVKNGVVQFLNWRKYEGVYLSYTICETEMLCFSHQVLTYRVSRMEKYGIREDN